MSTVYSTNYLLMQLNLNASDIEITLYESGCHMFEQVNN